MFIGYIYLISNIKNHKIYIGRKIGCPEKTKDYLGSGVLINKSISKNGKFYFKKIVLGIITTETKKELIQKLNEAEICCIEHFQSNNYIYGYNLTKGGDGFSGEHTLETKKKMSTSSLRLPSWNKGLTKEKDSRLICSEETRKKISKIKKEKGDKPTEYCRQRSIEVNKNKPSHMKGKHHSEESNRKNREAHLGSNNVLYHIPRSEETKRKAVETRRKNNSYKHTEETKKALSINGKDRIWITKDEKDLLIKKEFINYYLYYDWEIGRSISPMKNKKHSIETRKKQSESAKNKPKSKEHREHIRESLLGKTSWNKNIPCSKETIEKLRIKAHNRIWVFKENISTTIDKNLLDDYLQQGWKRGRLFKIKNPS